MFQLMKLPPHALPPVIQRRGARLQQGLPAVSATISPTTTAGQQRYNPIREAPKGVAKLGVHHLPHVLIVAGARLELPIPQLIVGIAEAETQLATPSAIIKDPLVGNGSGGR